MRDLLLCAKRLFVAAMRLGREVTWLNRAAHGAGGRTGGRAAAPPVSRVGLPAKSAYGLPNSLPASRRARPGSQEIPAIAGTAAGPAAHTSPNHFRGRMRAIEQHAQPQRSNQERNLALWRWCARRCAWAEA